MDGWRGHARSILSPLSKRVLTKAFRRLTMTVQQNLNVSRERWWRRTAQLSHCEAAALSDRLPLANNRKPPQLRALCSTNDTRIIPLHRPQQHGAIFYLNSFQKTVHTSTIYSRGEAHTATTCHRWKPIYSNRGKHSKIIRLESFRVYPS